MLHSHVIASVSSLLPLCSSLAVPQGEFVPSHGVNVSKYHDKKQIDSWYFQNMRFVTCFATISFRDKHITTRDIFWTV